MAKLLGADVLIKCLLQEDVRFVFGIPGAQPTTILDAIHRFGRSEGLDFVMTRHEQAAAHMADTYSRLTGKPGVCLATVGRGAVDLVPGVYEAYVNSIPILVLTAQNQTWRSYPDHGSTQGCDQVDLFRPITKWNALVSHWKRIPAMVQEAFRMATSGRPGPVHLDLPVDVLFEEKVKDRWKGRTPTNKLVFVESQQDLRGKVLPVQITWTGPWSMQGRLPHLPNNATTPPELASVPSP